MCWHYGGARVSLSWAHLRRIAVQVLSLTKGQKQKKERKETGCRQDEKGRVTPNTAQHRPRLELHREFAARTISRHLTKHL